MPRCFFRSERFLLHKPEGVDLVNKRAGIRPVAEGDQLLRAVKIPHRTHADLVFNIPVQIGRPKSRIGVLEKLVDEIIVDKAVHIDLRLHRAPVARVQRIVQGFFKLQKLSFHIAPRGLRDLRCPRIFEVQGKRPDLILIEVLNRDLVCAPVHLQQKRRFGKFRVVFREVQPGLVLVRLFDHRVKALILQISVRIRKEHLAEAAPWGVHDLLRAANDQNIPLLLLDRTGKEEKEEQHDGARDGNDVLRNAAAYAHPFFYDAPLLKKAPSFQ